MALLTLKSALKRNQDII